MFADQLIEVYHGDGLMFAADGSGIVHFQLSDLLVLEVFGLFHSGVLLNVVWMSGGEVKQSMNINPAP
jgi:hypothetical protein